MKYTTVYAVLIGVSIVSATYTTIVEVAESPYAQQAPPDIVAIAERTAALMGFTQPYEIVLPTKAGMHINPWNKFMAYNVNPQTKNPLIIVNSEWFLPLPAAQQDFLLGRYFLLFMHGSVSGTMKAIKYVFMLLSLILLALFAWLLKRTVLSDRSWWLVGLAAIGCAVVSEVLVLDKMQTKLMHNASIAYDMHINEMVIEKTQNREAAIKALEYFDASIKDAMKDPDEALFWLPYATYFESAARALKR